MLRSKLILLFLLLSASIVLHAQEEKQLIAVPSLSAVGVSDAEAATTRSMLETGLVKTEKFKVLSYNDVEEILEAQAFSLSGCVDDSCAIEVGELLSAEIIVMGELSRIGNGYALNVRMIDIASSSTLAAEVVNFDSLEEMRDASFNAAYSLAGLRYVSDSGSGLKEFGELYITAPGDAPMTVKLDGKEMGITPLLLRDVVFGVHLLQVYDDSNYLFEQEISLNKKGLTEIVADTALLKGNILLTVDPPVLREYSLLIDGEPAKLGLVNNLPAGMRTISIEGTGWCYYGEVTVKTGETIQTELPLKEAGSVIFMYPHGAAVKLIGDDGRVVDILAGEERILPTGRYSYELRHEDYETAQGTIVVKKMERTAEYPSLTHTMVWELNRDIMNLEAELEEKKKARAKNTTTGWIFNGIGIAGFTAGTIADVYAYNQGSSLLGLNSDYDAATTSDDAKSLAEQIIEIDENMNIARLIRNGSLIGGGVATVIGTLFLIGRPDISKIEEQIEQKKQQLEEAQ